ncbi:hypothetical protein D9615_004618 [Tricholomella constricta]|uniref:Uncharacterized protein n=1 Tax=Tricholomella constricta TaxID=117010 RepID=A0A8H5HCN9_9AGAR|nr:hypothetical protein D9615_004618 [Tricholomella constricta]
MSAIVRARELWNAAEGPAVQTAIYANARTSYQSKKASLSNEPRTSSTLVARLFIVRISAIAPVQKTTNVSRSAKNSVGRNVLMLGVTSIARRHARRVKSLAPGFAPIISAHCRAARYVPGCHVINGARSSWTVVIDVRQICPRCASPELKAKDVDMILGRTLGEIAADEDTLDELLITLPKCGHVFTVETLDGICGMSDYYTQCEADGTWRDLKAPVTQTETGERKKPPVCPTCRSAVTSPRYGRVYKSADLDILERNVISRMSGQLDAFRGMMNRISKAKIESALVTQAPTIVLESVSAAGSVHKICGRGRKSLLSNKTEIPVPADALNPGNEALFIVSPPVAVTWNKAVKPLIQLYERALKVAGMRSAHVKAWEAAWSCLCEQEMERALGDPARAPRNPNQYAMQMARMKVGQPQPRADKRFLVEAFWTTIQIRLILSDLAYAWLKAVNNKKNYTPQQSQMWAIFALFLLDGCQRDAGIALNIATASETRRQMTKTLLLIMRIDLEHFRFHFRMDEESGNLRILEQRTKVADKALDGATKVKRDIRRIVAEHCSVLSNDARDWIVDNFTETADLILQEWEKLERSVRSATFYEAVSLDEKMDIVKALDFGAYLR